MSFDPAPSFDIDVVLARGQREFPVRVAGGGGITALVGPSGQGKTSTLDAVAGLLRPLSGHIAVGGTVLFDAARGIDLPPERRAAGYVFQDLRLFPHLSVADNLLFGWRQAAPERRTLALDEVAGFLDIAPLLARRPHTLSGGEAQRVAIGRALLSGPRFLLMDEPLTALDPARREGVIALIARIRDAFALPVLLVSHQQDEVARLADAVVGI
ncbi:molybdate transport system ATP-binding protein [Novosphingobium capsulatum]|uniref:Molybdate transport system ATP-binding protein n=1 Tax=Novosphingobium capsulatum TaxID=13688 RepID=A0ABU1MIM8_9SPHN|nr:MULTISPECIES: ATP-binding cassette domain-containing protein [Novosphingobium]MDR6510183.1 molybdate transport system ATP-binding protein [Novosphingobium capsulatum]PTR12207.1 molybdate transport system ATP-binding protein [Novosphingobium sp. GV055]PUB05608.1 molybdate transport system ATP-binding protein [Novosphingobium sp. GV061]PUB21841.1 molybdate transport system ATP-binding protein [Novosphingobium sp. GV079]PUB43614.1 molybdate transport system ATP-binding protein [Novosphingobium